jgi:hypothetical protein
VDARELGEGACRWYWSWGGLDDGTRREIERLLGVGEAGAVR